MNNNLYLAWELARARQQDLLAWAREERIAQAARRARRAAIRPAAADPAESPLPCCQGATHRRAA